MFGFAIMQQTTLKFYAVGADFKINGEFVKGVDSG